MDKKQLLAGIGIKIKKAREKKRYSRDTLSFETGITTTQLMHIEHGKVNTSIYFLCKIAEALDVKIEELVVMKKE